MSHTLLYVLALITLSTSPLLARWSSISIEALGFWRLFIAALIIGCGQLLLKQRWFPRTLSKEQSQHSNPMVLPNRLSGRLRKFTAHAQTWAILSGGFFFLHLWTYFYAAHNTKIANAVVLFASNPIFTALISFLLFGEKMTQKLIWAYVIAGCGVLILVFENLDFNTAALWGNLSAIASAFFFAIYMNAGKMARQKMSNSSYSFIKYIISAALFLGVILVKKSEAIHLPPQGWGAIALMILLPTLLGHFLFSHLMHSMNLNMMTCGKLAEPALSALLALMIYQESIPLSTFLAFLLTATSVLILFWPRSWTQKKN